MTAAVSRPKGIPLGSSVPPMTPHAVSVSLPTWADNVGYEEGEKRVVEKMETGYPRFFVHRSIQKLATLCLNKFGRPETELCMLFPSPRVAAEARDFLALQTPSIPSRTVEFVICPSLSTVNAPPAPEATSSTTSYTPTSVEVIELQILLFNKEHWSFAKSFWQHTGDGVSSRLAERALDFMGETPPGVQPQPTTFDAPPQKNTHYSKNRHYAKRQQSVSSTPAASVPPTPSTTSAEPPAKTINDENLTPDLSTYLEERYGRNLPLFNAPLAKQALKRRIAGGLLPSDEDFGKVDDVARGAAAGSGKAVTPDDVYLYPGGMSAIWHAHNISRKVRRRSGEAEGKSLSYGFPYIDTLKILEKWGPGGILFGQGGSDDIEPLKHMLGSRRPEEPRILALFCEFPGNPLLRSPDLAKIRELADKHGFIVVVDETIGNFINVECMTYADIVVSSLTKIFSGESNVMGGSLVLNPNMPFYDRLKEVLSTDFEDLYYPEDAVYMERNSRDFRSRIKKVNDNAYDITEYLYSRSIEDISTSESANTSPKKVIKKVYYPRYVTPEIYAQAKRTPTLGKGGFGGLFSITFTSLAASKAFFDTIACAKGPSLGTSFTLASPYTLLAHYGELDWAAQYGVDSGLVRISVGQEDSVSLREWFEEAVAAAEKAGVEAAQ